MPQALSSKHKLFRLLTAALLTGATLALAMWMTVVVIQPGYENPRSRMYVSKLGQAAQTRKANEAFEVQVCSVETRTMRSTSVGEGMLQTEAVQVPLIAMSRIVRVNAEAGQRVKRGQVLVELDSSRLEIKINACRAAMEIAEAEYERTRIGSAYVLDMERPDRDTIRLDGVQREGALLDEMHSMYVKLSQDRVITRADLLEHQLRIEQHRTKLRETELALSRAKRGRRHSLEVAEAAIDEARLALEHRQNEMRDYKVICPVDGMVEQRFVNPGEYNQDPGRPAFLVTTGCWFEAHFDQTTWGQFSVGDEAEVLLEARPGQRIAGRVQEIHPYITYGLGGPEINRPIRPLGSGAPEWPATYKVRIALDDHKANVVPGMTGFARVHATRVTSAIPRSAARSVSSGRALLCLAEDDEVVPFNVRTGWVESDWVELLSPLDPQTRVICHGHEVLVEGDKIRVSEKRTARSPIQPFAEAKLTREGPQG